jgi:hypothetical protein
MTIDELLETVPAEVKAAIEEIEHKAGTIDADWEFIKAAGELIVSAKAEIRDKPVCPYCKSKMNPFNYKGYYDSFSGWGCECNEFKDANEFSGQYA